MIGGDESMKLTMYVLHVDAVDCERCYTLQTPSLTECRKWLDRYDHEGSSVCLEVIEDIVTRYLYNEEAYEKIEAAESTRSQTHSHPRSETEAADEA